MNVVKALPTLYSFSSKGKIKQWSASVTTENGLFYVCSSHGYLGQKIVEDYSSAVIGKNLGKKNETTPFDQALSEAQSKWQKKLDQNYSETIPESREEFANVRPMLAHKYSERSNEITFPAYVQPKLDGVRALATFGENGYTFNSRGSKTYDVVKHLKHAIDEFHTRSKIKTPWVFDGEIYKHGWSLQQISSAVKKDRDETQQLEFWIFDLAETTLPFEDRLRILLSFQAFLNLEENKDIARYIRIVLTREVANETIFLETHTLFSIEFEGTMIRNKRGMYRYDYRSVDLQKHKDFQDEDFLIVGGKQGSGADEGTVVFQCVTNDGKPFDVRPRGSREQRKIWFDQLPELVGKKYLTVRFQQLSDDGIPIFPVGIIIRDYE